MLLMRLHFSLSSCAPSFYPHPLMWSKKDAMVVHITLEWVLRSSIRFWPSGWYPPPDWEVELTGAPPTTCHSASLNLSHELAVGTKIVIILPLINSHTSRNLLHLGLVLTHPTDLPKLLLFCSILSKWTKFWAQYIVNPRPMSHGHWNHQSPNLLYPFSLVSTEPPSTSRSKAYSKVFPFSAYKKVVKTPSSKRRSMVRRETRERSGWKWRKEKKREKVESSKRVKSSITKTTFNYLKKKKKTTFKHGWAIQPI